MGFKEAFLNTYTATGTLNGVEVSPTVKTKNIFDATTAVEKEFPGFQLTGMHQVNKPVDMFSLGSLIFSILTIIASLIFMTAAHTFSWAIIAPIALGFLSITTLREDKTFDPFSFAALFLSITFIALTLVGMASFGTSPWLLLPPIALGFFSVFTLWRFSKSR